MSESDPSRYSCCTQREVKHTPIQGRVLMNYSDKKSLYLAVHWETRLECSYQMFALCSLTSKCCVNSLLCFEGKTLQIGLIKAPHTVYSIRTVKN